MPTILSETKVRVIVNQPAEASIRDLATAFAGMTADEQATFLCEVGRLMSAWPGGSMAMQLQAVGGSRELQQPGRNVITELWLGVDPGLLPESIRCALVPLGAC